MRGTGGVLVLCAEAALGASICAALRSQGLPGMLAEDVPDAVHRLADTAPLAVVVDLRFPGIAPEELVERALLCRATHGSLVVLLAPPDAIDAARDWIELGCAAILPTDGDPLDVARTVQSALQRVR